MTVKAVALHRNSRPSARQAKRPMRAETVMIAANIDNALKCKSLSKKTAAALKEITRLPGMKPGGR